MYLEQFIYIVEVYRAGTLSKAAKNCHVSIPGISQSISSLEEELGVKIFRRTRQGITPTNGGIKVVKKAYEILATLEELKEEVNPQNTLVDGELNLFASPSLIILLLKSAQAFKKDYPNIKIEITEQTAPEVMEAFKKNKVDIGFVLINKKLLEGNEDWEAETLIEVDRYVCVSKNSPLALNDAVDPQDILNQPLVVYNGINLKYFIHDFFRKYGEMTILFESTQIEIIKKTISEGIAISFLSELLLRNDPRILNGEIIPIPLKNCEQTKLPFGWIRLKKNHFSFIAKEFLKYVKTQIKQGNY